MTGLSNKKGYWNFVSSKCIYFKGVKFWEFLQDKGNLDAVLGEVVTLSPADAIAKLNQLIVRYPKCAPPLSEKMRLQLSTKDWTQALDTATRILSLEANNLSALEVIVTLESCALDWFVRYS